MANVKVKMLVNTAYQGPRKEGDVISVPEDFANRWVKNGIAAYVKDQGDVHGDENDTAGNVGNSDTGSGENKCNEGDTNNETPDYDGMSAKELYALCKERGIEVEVKQSKEYYIEKLA